MPTPEPQAEPIRLSTNAIFNGKFFTRGEVIPVERIADLPPHLQKVLATGDEFDEDETPNERTGAFQTNTLYQMTPEGHLGRRVRRSVERQAADLQAENDRSDW